MSAVVAVAILAGSASSGTGTTTTAPDFTLSPSVPFSALGALAASGPAKGYAVIPTVLHFNGNPPEDAGCTGDGAVDSTSNTCADLRTNPVLSAGPAARWRAVAGVNQTVDRNPVDPNWIWVLTSPTTLEGDMTVNWWQGCNAECIALGGTWRIRLWADGSLVFLQENLDASPALPHIPSRLTVTVTLPTVAATNKFVLHVDTQFTDTGQGAIAFYDSSLPCTDATTGPCDSTVTMPVVGPTEVRIASFGGRAERGRVVLRWRTASENGLVGFNVWRKGPSGERKVNDSLVAAIGGGVGASYRIVDRTARPGTTYTYRLQAVNQNGSRAWYGTAQVRTSR